MAGTELAKAYVQIIPSAQGIKQQLSDTLRPEVGGAGEAAGKSLGSSLMSSVKTIVAAAGIGTVIKKAFSEGADLQQSIGGIETLFKENADKVKEYANEAYKTAGLSANEYMENVTGFSASLLQSLGGDTALAAEAANTALTDMADNANKMGSSMESIQNAYQGFAKQNYTMLDNLKLGYGGTKTEMERLLADAEKLSGVDYSINNLSDVYEAIHVIQGEMEISGRTAEEAAEIFKNTGRVVNEQLGTTAKEGATTFTGALASMKASASNLLGKLTLGEDISKELNALSESVFTFFGRNLLPMLGNLSSNLPGVAEQAISMIVRSINGLSDNADSVLQFGIDLVIGLADAMISGIPYLLEAAWNLIRSFGQALAETDWMQVGSNLILRLQESMQTASGEIFGTDNSIITAFTESLKNNLPQILQQGVEIITNLANGILQSIPQIYLVAADLVMQLQTCFMENAPMAWSAGVDLIINLVNGIIENLPTMIDAVVQVVIQFVSTIGENLPMVLESGLMIIAKLAVGLIEAIPKVVSVIPQIFQSIKEGFLSKDWLSIGWNIIEGIKNGIVNGIGMIKDAAINVAKTALQSVKDILGIKSPSREFMKIGEFVTEGFANGITDSYVNVERAMQKLTAINIGDFEQKAGATQGIQTGYGLEDILELTRAASTKDIKVFVTLEGDAKRMFRVMQSEIRDNQILTGKEA